MSGTMILQNIDTIDPQEFRAHLSKNTYILVAFWVFLFLPNASGNATIDGMLSQIVITIPVFLSVFFFSIRIPYQVGILVLLLLTLSVVNVGVYFINFDRVGATGILSELRVLASLAAIVFGATLFPCLRGRFFAWILVSLTAFVLVLYVLSQNLILTGLVDLWYARGSDELGQSRAYYHYFRMAGTFNYPGEAAIAFNVLYWLWRVGRPKRFEYLAASLLVVLVFLTQSRFGIVLTGMTLFCVYSRSFRSQMLAVFGFSILVGILVFFLDVSYFMMMFQNLEAANYLARLNEIAYMISQWGAGFFADTSYAEYKRSAGTIESYYLTRLLRGGWVSIALLLVQNISLFAIVARGRSDSEVLIALRKFLLMVIAANVLIFDLVSGIFIQGKGAVLLWILVGVFLAAVTMERNARGSE